MQKIHRLAAWYASACMAVSSSVYAAASNGNEDGRPQEHLCPISRGAMTDPVSTTTDERHFERCRELVTPRITDPLTNSVLTNETLPPKTTVSMFHTESLREATEHEPTDRDRERQDWLIFLSNAHNMTEEQVKREIKTPAVLEAFERVKLATLPANVRRQYEAEVEEYDRFSEYTDKLVKKGRKEGEEKGRDEERSRIVDAMIGNGMSDTQILKVVVGLTPAQLQARHDALKK